MTHRALRAAIGALVASATSCQVVSGLSDLHVVTDAGSSGAGPLGHAIVWKKDACASTTHDLSAALDFAQGEAFTVEFWFRPDSVTDFHSLVFKGGSSEAFPGWTVETNSTDIYLACQGNAGGVEEARANGALTQGHLVHVVATRNGSQGAIYLLDATAGDVHHQRLGTTETFPTSWLNTQRLAIAGQAFDATSCSYVAPSALDDVRIWGKMRTNDEFDADYAGEIPCDTDGLLGYWRIDEGSGFVLQDCSPVGANLTVNEGNPPDNFEWVDSPFDSAL